MAKNKDNYIERIITYDNGQFLFDGQPIKTIYVGDGDKIKVERGGDGRKVEVDNSSLYNWFDKSMGRVHTIKSVFFDAMPIFRAIPSVELTEVGYIPKINRQTNEYKYSKDYFYIEFSPRKLTGTTIIKDFYLLPIRADGKIGNLVKAQQDENGVFYSFKSRGSKELLVYTQRYKNDYNYHFTPYMLFNEKNSKLTYANGIVADNITLKPNGVVVTGNNQNHIKSFHSEKNGNYITPRLTWYEKEVDENYVQFSNYSPMDKNRYQCFDKNNLFFSFARNGKFALADAFDDNNQFVRYNAYAQRSYGEWEEYIQNYKTTTPFVFSSITACNPFEASEVLRLFIPEITQGDKHHYGCIDAKTGNFISGELLNTVCKELRPIIELDKNQEEFLTLAKGLYRNTGFDFSVETQRFSEPVIEKCGKSKLHDEDTKRMHLGKEEADFINSGLIDRYAKISGVDEPVKRLLILTNPEAPEGIENKENTKYDYTGLEKFPLVSYIDGNTGEFLQGKKLDAVLDEFGVEIDQDQATYLDYSLDLLKDVYNLQNWNFKTSSEIQDDDLKQ